jgi:alkylation response protein AidB-like acyl-CoA dehydrogenase
MNLEPSAEQEQVARTFSRFLDENSSTAQVRAALPSGFDRALWKGLAELGALAMRVPESADGLGLGLLDAVLVMEEAGRRLASGPLAEAIVTARLLAQIGGEAEKSLLAEVMAGDAIAVLALHDGADKPQQWVTGGAIADAVIARVGDKIVRINPGPERRTEANLASQPTALIDIAGVEGRVIAEGAAATAAFEAAVEEWKLLVGAALSGLSQEAIRLACAYACERVAFGQAIGTYQSISHPLADLAVYVDGGKYAVWSAIRAIADGADDAAAQISMALWLCSDSASQAVAQSLHTFGGYGLTIDYDIHLFNVRAKAWPLALGDPKELLEESGRRLYHGEAPALPGDVGTLTIEFDPGPEAEALAAETRAFFEKNLTPELRAKAHYSTKGHDAGIHRKLAEANLLFPDWPIEYGGRAVSPYSARAASAVWEEFNWTGQVAGLTRMVGYVIARFGNEQLKHEVLSRITAGESACSLGFSEPGSGSDVFAAKTRATRDGDGWRIDGSKMFTSGAQYADYILMLARTDPEAQKHRGLTTFIVPLKSKGVEIQRVETFQDEPTNITYYDGVWIPDAYRLGEEGGGLTVMLGAFEIEHGVSFVNVHRRMLRAAEQYCREHLRKNGAMIDDPAVYARLARVAANVLAGTMLTYRSLWTSAEKRYAPAFGPSTKMFTSERYRTDSSDLLDLLAPDSLLKDTGPEAYVNQCYRHSQVSTVYAGTTEVHRSMIAEKQLGLPRTRH